jgi:hypothetical protein
MSTRGEALRRAAMYALVLGVLAAYAWAGLARGDWWGVSAWSLYPVVGAVILRERPGHGVGRIMMGVGVAWAVVLAVETAGSAWPAWVEVLGAAAGYQGWTLLMLLVALYPTGRPQTRLGRVVTAAIASLAAAVAALSLVDPGAIDSGRPNPVGVAALAGPLHWFFDEQGFLVVPLVVLAALVDLARRWRRASGDERLQYRWLTWAVALVVVALSFDQLPDELIVATNLVPLAIGIAVTRHGLYGIDRVVSRTVSYVVVSTVVVAVYAAVVTTATTLLPVSDTLAVASATLAAAAAARPALRRVQELVDRRFNQGEYDARQVVDGFGATLRSSVGTDASAAQLVTAVDRALQPAAAGLWLRSPA